MDGRVARDGSLLLAQFEKSLLFGIQPTDAVTFVVVPLGLLIVALAAALIPAWRAPKISPMQAIKRRSRGSTFPFVKRLNGFRSRRYPFDGRGPR